MSSPITAEDAQEIQEIARLLVDAFETLQARRREVQAEAEAATARAEERAREILAQAEAERARIEAEARQQAEEVLRQAEERAQQSSEAASVRRREALRQPMEELRAAVEHLKAGGFLGASNAGDLASAIEGLRPLAAGGESTQPPVPGQAAPASGSSPAGESTETGTPSNVSTLRQVRNALGGEPDTGEPAKGPRWPLR